MKRLDLPVSVALAVMLTAGWALLGSVEARTITFADPQGTLRLNYPSGWLAVPGSPNLLEVADPLSGAGIPISLTLTRQERPADRTLERIVSEGIPARSQQLVMYRVLGQRPLRVAGRDAVAVEYAFVTEPHEAVLAAERLPVVVRGIEVVILTNGAVYRVDLRSAAGTFDRARAFLERTLREIQL